MKKAAKPAGRRISWPDLKAGTGKAVTVALPAVAYALVACFIIYQLRGFITSDYTDTIMWAQASFNSGRLISRDFSYAALLPFGGSLLMLPFLPFFGVSMTTQILGMLLFAAIFFWSVAFACRQMGFSGRWQAIAVFLLTLNLSASEKLREMLWGHVIYYSLGLLFLFITLGLVYKILNQAGCGNHAGAGVNLLILTAFLILAATDSVQVLVLFALPVIGSLLIEQYLDFEKRLLHRDHRAAWIVLAAMAIAIFCGLVLKLYICGSVKANYEDAHAYYSDMNNWMVNFEKMVISWFSLLGVTAKDNDKLVSLASLAKIIRITYGIVLIVLPVSLAARYRRIDDNRLKALFGCHMVVTALISFLFITGKLATAAWRLIPVVGTASLLLVAYSRYLMQSKATRRIAATLLTVSFLTAGLAMGALLTAKPVNTRENKLDLIARNLAEQDLSYGYATFWQANVITLLSDSKVQVRNIAVTEKGIAPEPYQTQLSWYKTQNDVSRYFLLLSSSEYTLLKGSPMWEKLTAITDDEQESAGYHLVILNQNPFS